MKQQTAVEWLMETMKKTDVMDWDLVFIQAKAMEKEQIINGASNENIFKIVEYWLNQQQSNLSLFEWRCKIKRDAEQYYNETYKNK